MFIYEQFTDGAWMIYSGYNKTDLHEIFQKPIADIANLKYLCYKWDSLDLINSPMPANHLPDNQTPAHIFEIAGNPDQAVYSFDVKW